MDYRRKKIEAVSRKMAFSKFVASKKKFQNVSDYTWECCDTMFNTLKEIHKHTSTVHNSEILKMKAAIIEHGDESSNYPPLKRTKLSDDSTFKMPQSFESSSEYPWLPSLKNINVTDTKCEKEQILLFYHYRDIQDTKHVLAWQSELCKRLHLTGKVRIAKEGLNATVAGTISATELYIKSILSHPMFEKMEIDQFKKSPGSTESFPDGLKIGIYQEAVPMGIDPEKVSFNDAGKHLNPEEFHQAITDSLKTKADGSPNSLIIDCRNFYESKIGQFDGAVCPDIRKFSYWPEYVDMNLELFKDKNVYMYCTGGIRCERGSAYLKTKGVCKEVFQLEGGIHKYIEKYPEGHFKGKLFVFDDRYHIEANKYIISECVYCKEPWDKYQPCSSKKCHQLVLSCESCRNKKLTACCRTCQEKSDNTIVWKEQCECTNTRPRIPVDAHKTEIYSNTVETKNKTDNDN